MHTFYLEQLTVSSNIEIDKTIFFFAPIITFLFSLVNWVVIPFSKFSFIAELSLSSLYILAGSALGIYGINFRLG